MRCPFPGMDPWLEHPSLWPDVHNSLIVAIREDLSPRLAPHYYVGLERRAYQAKPDDLVLVGRPDLSFLPTGSGWKPEAEGSTGSAAVDVLDVDVPMADSAEDAYLEVRGVFGGELVTIIGLLSPANKVGGGREQYERKRQSVCLSKTNLVEIDLMRDGEPMPTTPRAPRSDYRILISRGASRPRGKLYSFGLRHPIPTIPLPLRPGEEEPAVDLNAILHAMYTRARFDLQLRYDRPPAPPLREADAAWAETLRVKA